MEAIFRKAMEEDAPAILSLFKRAVLHMNENGINQWDEIYPTAELLLEDIKNRQLYVLTEEGKICSAIVLNEMQDPEYLEISWKCRGPFAVIHRLCVDPDIQSRGIGRRTVLQAEISLAGQGYKSIRLDAFPQNPKALKLYEGLGYLRMGNVTFRKGTFYVYEKELLKEFPLQTKIGIIGGGQLGKMMILEAKKMGFYTAILDPEPKCPAHSIADKHIQAAFDDKEAIRRLAEETDVLTYEFEHIDSEILIRLESEGKKIYPTAKSLMVIQNKLSQKNVLKEAGLPVPDFMEVREKSDIKNAARLWGYPLVLKTCTGGYDGKGNALILCHEEINDAFKQLGSGSLPLMVEKFVGFDMEISVLACRGIDGQVCVYPVAANTHKDNILIKTIAPAPVSKSTAENARALAGRVMEVFEGVGMFCVEMFAAKDGGVFINEVAPRPHNSGHYTIEACVTSQFEQHIRAVAGLPFGDVALIRPAVMMNILGSGVSRGKAIVLGAGEALKIKGAMLHIYGKEICAPKRKMGHLTVTAETPELAEKLAETASRIISIVSASEGGK